MADRRIQNWPLGPLVGSTILAGVLIVSQQSLASETEFFAEPTWQPVDAPTVYQQLDAYLQSGASTTERQQAARAEWWDSAATSGAANDLLDRLANSLAPTDDRVAELVTHCLQTEPAGILPEFAWLADSQTPALVRHNMRLYYARWLVQNNYYDEALAWTDGLRPEDVVAPDVLLFYRAVADHRLVHADQADAMIAELMQRPADLPIRYQKLAALMRHDLAGLEDESLDHIARRMADVRRRLELGRAGKMVQGVEQGVLDSLDKLIKRAEEQAQQQAQPQPPPPGGQPSGRPMQDSRIAELKGPGKVDPRSVGRGADWGDLPDKEREQALQEIGRDFPSHYREVIEEYFRRLAAEPTDDLP